MEKDDESGDDVNRGFAAEIDTKQKVSPKLLVIKCLSVLNREVDQIVALAEKGILDPGASRKLNDYCRTSIAIAKDLNLDDLEELADAIDGMTPEELAAAVAASGSILGLSDESVNEMTRAAKTALKKKKEENGSS
jgi:hypothetical protein